MRQARFHLLRSPVLGTSVLAVAAFALTACSGSAQMQWSSSQPNSAAAPTTASSTASSSSAQATSSAAPTTTRSARSSTATPTSSAAARPQGDAAPPCLAANLTVDFSPEDHEDGKSYTWANFTNIGSTACALTGFFGVQLVDRSGVDLPSQVVERTDFPQDPVVMQPHERAMASLTWDPNTVAPGYATCYRPGTILLYPKKDHDVTTTRWEFPDCGPITIGPYKHNY